MGINIYTLGLTILTKWQILDGNIIKISIISPLLQQRAKPMVKIT